MKYLGCAYYPEYWGVERVPTDAALMQDAGVNIVRIGEFAWSRMEPEEGRFTLDWLHQTVDILGQHGINVLMCTPTATPPAWLTCTYPDTLLMKPDGRRLEHGERRHYCYSSDTYRRHTYRIVEQLSAEFAAHANVVAWQIDNEPDLGETGTCMCESCQGKFQAWLKQKYGSIEDLNQKWATGFWSMDYTDWRQVRLGRSGHYSSRQLDTRRFANEMLSDFVMQQAAIIKQNHPSAIVSTNLNGGIFTALDYNRLFASLDMAFKDLYFDIHAMDVNAMILNQCRSFKPGKKFWITETGAGMCGTGRPPRKAQFNAWLWSNYAHGGDAHVVFRWRTCLSGQEQELEGMLEHAGQPGHRYQAVRAAFHQMRAISAELGELPLPQASAALVHDYDVMWGYQSSVIGGEINYEKNFSALHQQLYKRNVLADVITPRDELSRYKLVILPSLMMLDAAFAEKLKAYLAAGGVVLAQGQLGMRDDNDNYLSVRGPEHLQDTFGVLINGGMYLYSCVGADESWSARSIFAVKLGGQLGGSAVSGSTSIWLGDVEAHGSQTLLTIMEDTYAGQPVVVENAVGAGLALYCAAIKLDDGLMDKLFEYALHKAGVDFRSDIPAHVEVVQRGNATFVINHLDRAVELELDLPGKVLRGTLQDGTALLKPYDVLIVVG